MGSTNQFFEEDMTSLREQWRKRTADSKTVEREIEGDIDAVQVPRMTPEEVLVRRLVPVYED